MSWFLIDHVNHGREHFNFSEWSTYSEDDKDKLLGSICSLTKKGRMPLSSYLLLHRDATLSDAGRRRPLQLVGQDAGRRCSSLQVARDAATRVRSALGAVRTKCRRYDAADHGS